VRSHASFPAAPARLPRNFAARSPRGNLIAGSALYAKIAQRRHIFSASAGEAVRFHRPQSPAPITQIRLRYALPKFATGSPDSLLELKGRSGLDQGITHACSFFIKAALAVAAKHQIVMMCLVCPFQPIAYPLELGSEYFCSRCALQVHPRYRLLLLLRGRANATCAATIRHTGLKCLLQARARTQQVTKETSFGRGNRGRRRLHPGFHSGRVDTSSKSKKM
jgi:hypothetical protein